MVAVPADSGVKIPETVSSAPPWIAKVRAGLNAPVPCTLSEQVDVCVSSMEVGEQETLTEVIADCVAGAATLAFPPATQPEIAISAPAAAKR